MFSEPITLYKLMVLYMLKKVNFPLSNAQMSDFFLNKEYTNYFTFQQVLNELLESNLIRVETIRNTSRYEMTKEGDEVLYYFGNKISEAIVEDMDQFLKDNKFKLRNETGIVSDYYKSTDHDYVVHCEVREGKSVLLEVNVSVPGEEQASAMCDNWKNHSQEIYAYIMKKLM
ncbi:MAG: DUF4364 family protein [Lachnospiraceae bacterium]|nr:DUF4364 family protein [Candidatus Fimimorpha excrementavium]